MLFTMSIYNIAFNLDYQKKEVFTTPLIKVSVNENFSTLLDFVFFGFLA